MKHLARNFKKEQQLQERFTEIERENTILLDKMTNIMTGNTGEWQEVYTKAQPTRGDAVPGQSLNAKVRRLDADRIARENKHMLQRILQRKANYDHKAQLADREVSEGYLGNLKKFHTPIGFKPAPPMALVGSVSDRGPRTRRVQGRGGRSQGHAA